MNGQIDFEEIYNKYAKRVFNYIFMRCKNKEIAEDVTQITFLKAIEHADRFRFESSVITWLYQIAKNTLLDEISRYDNNNIRLSELEGTDYLFVDDIDILSDLINDEEKINLYKSIHRLDEIQREIILQRLVGLSFKEIGNR